MRVAISPLAERDLERIGDYIAEDNPARAVGFVAELRDQCATFAKAQLTIARVLHGATDIPSQFAGE